jgi:DNA-binding transcriptional ArsR family regulator
MKIRLSPRAAALSDRLLAHVQQGPVRTRADLEAWWGQRSGVQRVELFRLLADLVDEGHLHRHGPDAWGATPPVPEAPPTPRPAPVPLSITLGTGDDAVTVTGANPDRVRAVALGYQRDAVRGGTGPVRLAPATPPPPPPAPAPPPAPTPPSPKVDPRPVPTPGTTAARILTLLRRGKRTTAEVVERLDLAAPTVRGRLSELTAAGWLVRDEAGRWSVVP